MSLIWHPFTLWILVLFAISYTTFYPGLLNADSIDQLSQSLAHQYRDWHSPLMSATWSLLNRIHRGPALLLLLDQATFYLAAFVFASIVFPRSWLKFAWVTGLVFYPPIFNILGLVSCDGFYVPIVFLGYALALKSLSEDASESRWLNAFSQALLMISVAVRREGVMAAAAALFVLDWNLLRNILRPSRRFVLRVTALSLCCVGFTILTSVIAIQLFNSHVLNSRHTYPYQPTLLYDLVALSVEDHNNYLPASFNPQALTVADLEERFDPAMGDSFIFGTQRVLVISYDSNSVAQLRHAWRTEVRRNWRQYLSSRYTLSLYLLGVRTAQLPRFQFISEQRTFGYFKDLGEVNAAFQPNPITRFYDRVSQATFGWPIYLGWFYCLISLVCLCLHSGLILLRKGNSPTALIGVALAAGGLMQTALLSVAAPSPLFRYLDWPVLASILSLTLAMRLLMDVRRTEFRFS